MRSEKTFDIAENTASAARIVSALYKLGYDELNIRFAEPKSCLKIQKEVTNHLMTFEIEETQINKGGTIAHFNVETVYSGVYFVKISNDSFSLVKKVIIE